MKEFKNSLLNRKDLISQVCYDQFFNYLTKILPGCNNYHHYLKDKLIGFYSTGYPILSRAGTVSDKCWFINEGLVIAYYDNHDKTASVYAIFIAGEIAMLPNSFVIGEVSTGFLMAYPGTHLLELSDNEVLKMNKLYPETEKISIAILAYHWRKNLERDRLLRFIGKERIQEFYKSQAGVILADKKVPRTQKVISSYLLIKESTFSRLRKEIREEE